MRFIIFGVGAIGGTVAVSLARAGEEVIGIARGRQLAAIRENGLTLRTPEGDRHARFACVESPSEIDLRDDDAILLCMKSQDTEAALASLRAAGAVRQPIFCLQNGVANERMALRLFEHVYGVTVMMPSDFTTPGEVVAFGIPKVGIFDIGRYPAGVDATAKEVAARLTEADMQSFVADDVMASKYGKLLLNLANVVDGAFASREMVKEWSDAARAEALAAYKAAGIVHTDVGIDDPRRKEYLHFGEIAGIKRVGSSSMQSLLRHAGSIETDYLNGEIVLLGRLHGVKTPVNAAYCRIGQKLVSGALGLGAATVADLEAEIAAG